MNERKPVGLTVPYREIGYKEPIKVLEEKVKALEKRIEKLEKEKK
jgi:polyhydroxyalkanoate synthesis regulator phasin